MATERRSKAGPDRLSTTEREVSAASFRAAAAQEARYLNVLTAQVDAILRRAREHEQQYAERVRRVHPQCREGARNLLHYLALRTFDIRELQGRLTELGLSSLGRAEAHVGATLQAVSKALRRLAGRIDAPPDLDTVDFRGGQRLLKTHAEALFGKEPAGNVPIMVTFPSEAADDYRLVRDLLAAGMDCARINCAHDEARAWGRMVEHVRRAERETGQRCRISMDLAGPKLRTGPLEPGPRVLRWKPRRDARGRVVTPAQVWLAPPGVRPPEGPACDVHVPVEADWLAQVQPGDRLRLRDARGKKRRLEVVERQEAGCRATATQTAYVETGTVLEWTRKGAHKEQDPPTARVGSLPAVEHPLLLKPGDPLVLHRAPVPGAPAVYGEDGSLKRPAHVACTLPEVFDDVRAGEPVKFDDGKIEGVIRTVSSDEIEVEITRARPEGSLLRADKSINLPESHLRLRGMTEKDRADLDVVARHADLVGLSFASAPEDVAALQNELRQRQAERLGIVLKIETQRGFERLPWLLLEAMRSYPVGVMIARGDLAVECGWERMAEVQEEILWLCEAAHVPVIWATQVLENLAKKGLPSRAEITDAAMAERAECVMLNKGPHVVEAVRALDDISRRMQAHQRKKTSVLRRLHVASLREEEKRGSGTEEKA